MTIAILYHPHHPIYSVFCLGSTVSKEKKNPGYRDKLLQIIIILLNELCVDKINLQSDSNGTKKLYSEIFL